ncbi:helix-turn-helix domain-containing protein [Rhodoglobus aureus]|uniref:Helix-turn-helix domain-containing protein n=1 Tax=Rhodoglobus aureus TaxID=191497 RepID=A0ABN1VK19_9MICO
MTNSADKITTHSPILTPAQVAGMLQVPVRTLEEWRHKKSGPPYRKVGRHIRYQHSKVMDWFDNNG